MAEQDNNNNNTTAASIREGVYYTSRYIVDVAYMKDYIELKDSGGKKFYIDKSDKAVLKEFNTWFKTCFCVQTPGLLTKLMAYSVNVDMEIIMQVKKIVSLHPEYLAGTRIPCDDESEHDAALQSSTDYVS